MYESGVNGASCSGSGLAAWSASQLASAAAVAASDLRFRDAGVNTCASGVRATSIGSPSSLMPWST